MKSIKKFNEFGSCFKRYGIEGLFALVAVSVFAIKGIQFSVFCVLYRSCRDLKSLLPHVLLEPNFAPTGELNRSATVLYVIIGGIFFNKKSMFFWVVTLIFLRVTGGE